jgi:hypothetical protein
MALLGAKHARGDGGVELVFPHRVVRLAGCLDHGEGEGCRRPGFPTITN